MTRVDTLEALIRLEKPLNESLAELANMPWDSQSDLVILSRANIARVLDKFLTDQLSAHLVEQWANAIESREDIGFESGYEAVLRDAIWELANPELSNKLDVDRAKEIVALLIS